MTQNNAGERRQTQVSVRTAEQVGGTYGPQWLLTVTYPWSQGRTSKAWIPRDEFAPAPEPGQYNCLVERGTRWSTTSDDDAGWNWKIIGSLSQAEGLEPSSETSEAPTKSFAPPADTTRTSIERQTAGKEVGGWVREMIAKGLIVDMPSAVQAYVGSIDAVHEATAAQTPARTEDPMDGTDEPFPHELDIL